MCKSPTQRGPHCEFAGQSHMEMPTQTERIDLPRVLDQHQVDFYLDHGYLVVEDVLAPD